MEARNRRLGLAGIKSGTEKRQRLPLHGEQGVFGLGFSYFGDAKMGCRR
jgi:hypothetical protein